MPLDCNVQVPSFWMLLVQQCQFQQSCKIPITTAFFDSSYYALSSLGNGPCDNDARYNMTFVGLWTCAARKNYTYFDKKIK